MTMRNVDIVGTAQPSGIAKDRSKSNCESGGRKDEEAHEYIGVA